jgi:hypothetical protein
MESMSSRAPLAMRLRARATASAARWSRRPEPPAPDRVGSGERSHSRLVGRHSCDDGFRAFTSLARAGHQPFPQPEGSWPGCHARALGGVFMRTSKRPRRTPWPAARAKGGASASTGAPWPLRSAQRDDEAGRKNSITAVPGASLDILRNQTTTSYLGAAQWNVLSHAP